jgi:hypothetical protein
MNQIELWFGVLSRRLLGRGNFFSLADLRQRIEAFIRYYNAHDAFPYEWTYTGKPLTGTRTEARRHRIRYGRRRLCIRRTTLNRRF